MKKYDYFSVVHSGKVFWETVTVAKTGKKQSGHSQSASLDSLMNAVASALSALMGADVKSMGTIFYKTKKHLKRDALNQGYQDSNLENDGVRVRCLTVWR